MHNRLAVIGFDAQLDGLENVDQVAAAFYTGEYDSSTITLTDTNRLYQLTAARVLQASKLKAQQTVLVIIDGQQGKRFEHKYSRCERVSSLADGLILSRQIIAEENLAVLIAAAYLQANELNQQLATMSYDQVFSGYRQSNGVASVLLSSVDFAATERCYIYSYLSSFAVTEDLAQIEPCIAQSFAQCGLNSQSISSLEVSAPAQQRLNTLEQNALLSSYHNGLTLHTSVSCVKSVIGESGPLSQLCGFLNTILALQQRYRAGIKAWQEPQQTQLPAWLDSPFYLLNEAAPAFPEKDGAPRYMAYSCLSDERYAHLIVRENADNKVHDNGFIANSRLSLFILSGDSQAQLKAQLQQLGNSIYQEKIKVLAKQYYQAYLQDNNARFQMVLLADSACRLAQEVDLAFAGISDAFARNKDWKTPWGSYLCVNPSIAPKTCFLYPGIGATYLGLGRDLLHLFPDVYPSVQRLINDSSAGFKDQLLNPRSLVKLDFKQLKQHDLTLRSCLADIAECGVGYACIFTRIFTDVLNVKADFAGGYSMGEVSMFAALNCWKAPGKMSARLADSQTFNEQLSGELKTLRSLWRLPATAKGGEKLLWESYNIKGSAAQVEQVIRKGERVYITLINTSDSLVIAGYPEDCLAVAQRLGVRALALNVHNAIHCEPAYQQYQQMIELYSMELAERVTTKLYSSSCYLPIPFNKKAIAVGIAKCLCEQVDFPRLIKALDAQGASLFIEMGAGRALCTWTDKILAANPTPIPRITVAVNSKGSDQLLMIMRAIAKLISAGVKVNLKHFFDRSVVVQKKAQVLE